MGDRPLVSMMMVAHDAERTLGLALASVIAQTVEDWECIVVDDGSSRAVGDLTEELSDPRIRIIRLDENHGRGYARSRALEAVRGRLCGVLDADDWMYPTRLERQIARLESDRRLQLVASSMLIENEAHGVIGVQEAVARHRPRFGTFPFSFAPILVESDLARRIGFRPELTRSEDVPFLARALGSPWACIGDPLYVYRPSHPTRASTLESYRCTRRAYSLYRGDHPVSARRLELSYRMREIVHRLVPERVSRQLTAQARARVVRPASLAERRDHDVALVTVRRILESKSTCMAARTGEITA